MRVVTCPKCKKTNMGNMTQCLICKTPLPSNTLETASAQTKKQPEKKCPACGTSCPPGARYCPECAIELPPWIQNVQTAQPVVQKKFCPKCGKARQGSKQFCASCGYDFNS